MLTYIKELFIGMIEDIPWDAVLINFVMIMAIAVAAACFLGGLVWACVAKSLWPLLLMIVTIFIISIFAAIDQNR